MPYQEEETKEQEDPGADAPATERSAQLRSNLALVLPPRVDVDIMEFDESKDEDGEVVLVPRIRHAVINCWVPMRVFHSMLLERENLLALKAASEDGSLQNNLEKQGQMMNWVQEQVVAVWRFTEPKMTLERLTRGLEFDQVLELFQRFFDALMKRVSSNAKLKHGR